MSISRKWFFICGAIALVLVILDRVFPVIEGCPPITNRQRSQMYLQSVVTACSTYRVEFGNWPQGDTTRICEALFGGNPHRLVFLDVDPRFRDANGQVLDAWQTPLQISVKDEGITVTAAGRDQQFGTVDEMALAKRS